MFQNIKFFMMLFRWISYIKSFFTQSEVKPKEPKERHRRDHRNPPKLP